MGGTAIPEPVTAVTDLAGAWLPARLTEVERRLGELVAGHGEPLATDAGSTLSAGGKRMRPLLVLLCAGPSAGREAIRAATAIELVHMATLVHDDVLDAAPIRRGRPTVFATSGRDRALATGDLLFSRAFAELTEPGSERQVSALAAASTALARGELAQRRDAFEIGVSAERYFERCRLKTATLFECACVIGRERPVGERDVLRAFGGEIGLAFQLLDDVLDVVGPPERTGKARGTDLLDGTVNLPLIRAREIDTGLAELDLRALDAAAAEEVCDRIAATGATGAVRGEARERVERAKRGLVAAELPADARRMFELVADGVVERYS
ncbi:MAG TPA: polyprenyl synthetase family protein [Solirubrobacterales bacterium]|nr:polyprenyl synthetase family protein [Solirubrobacterales bacterium]